MKVLVATACVAIIAFVGYFFWERYAEASREQLAANCYEFRERNQNRPDPAVPLDDDGMYEVCFEYFLANPPSDGAR